MNQKQHRAIEAAVRRCETALITNPSWQWSDDYRQFYSATMDQIGQIRYRPGLVTQLRRRMQKVRPIAPPTEEAPAP